MPEYKKRYSSHESNLKNLSLQTEQFDEQQGTRGDLIVGLKFETQESNASRGKGTLHVLVKEAKNLVATKPNGQADVFCKRLDSEILYWHYIDRKA